MFAAEGAPLPPDSQRLREVSLDASANFRFFTEGGARYKIIPHAVAAGSARFHLTRKQAGAEGTLVAVDASVVSAGRAGFIAVGENVEITALDISNGRRFELTTSRVHTIKRHEKVFDNVSQSRTY